MILKPVETGAQTGPNSIQVARDPVLPRSFATPTKPPAEEQTAKVK